MKKIENNLLDLHGKQVHAFTIQVGNLGFSQMTDLLLSMFKSNAWRHFKDGLGVYNFLPGEFDYFLTQRGVKREDIINGIRDIEVKAKLEKAMDERRTGEENYRRRIEQARSENPVVPGRPLMPFGFMKSEAKYLKLKTGAAGAHIHREPLGHRIRHFTNHGTKKRDSLSLLERLIRSAAKLDDADLDKLLDSLKRERERRKHGAVRLVAVK